MAKFKPGQSGNPGGRPKSRYNLHNLKNLIIDRFGGMQPWVNYWYEQDRRYLSDWLKEFVKKEARVDGKQSGRLIVQVMECLKNDNSKV